MGMAKKCDRCGKYYDFNGNNNANGLVKVYRNSKSDITKVGPYIDLCDDCMSILNSFLDGDKAKKPFIQYIYEKCKEHKCTIDLRIDVDGVLIINAFSKHGDCIIIRADWGEETIKESIDDVIRRACRD